MICLIYLTNVLFLPRFWVLNLWRRSYPIMHAQQRIRIYVYTCICILCIYYSTILCSSLNEMLLFTYNYFHISWTLASKSHKKGCHSIVFNCCVCYYFILIIYIYIYIYIYLFSITWVCYFVVYEFFSEQKII